MLFTLSGLSQCFLYLTAFERVRPNLTTVRPPCLRLVIYYVGLFQDDILGTLLNVLLMLLVVSCHRKWLGVLVILVIWIGIIGLILGWRVISRRRAADNICYVLVVAKETAFARMRLLHFIFCYEVISFPTRRRKFNCLISIGCLLFLSKLRMGLIIVHGWIQFD